MREPDRIIRLKTVLSRTGLSRSTIYRKIAEGTFPAQIKISVNGSGWREVRYQPLGRRSRRMASETRVRCHAVTTKDGGLCMSKNLTSNLESAEAVRVGKALVAERGLQCTPSKIGEYVSGTLVGSTQLASGRFAMIDDGIGFQFVPWQPVLEQRIGRHITGVMRDAGGIDWNFGRNRRLEL